MRRTSGVLAGVPLAIALFLASVARADAPVQVPVVLDVHGLNGSHYVSDLTVVNLSATASDVEVTFVGTLGPSAEPLLIAYGLNPGRTLYVGDVIETLRGLGASFPEDGSPIVGTLSVRLTNGDATPPFVGSRVSTPNPDTLVGGSFGTFTLGTPVGSGLNGVATVYGLRENEGARTNLAFVHAGGGANKPIQLSVQVYDGATGNPAADTITVTLDPGGWFQIPSVLSAFGFAQGWAKVRLVSGNDRFLTYAVVNDGGVQGGGTSDGSWIDANPSEGTLPVILSSGTYRTELVLARPVGSSSEFVTLTYSSSEFLTGANVNGAAHFTMPLNTQMVIPDAIAFLREQNVPIPADGPQGGTLRVSGAVAMARVYSPNPNAAVGGTFGVAFRAVPPEARADTEAWIYALRQDTAVRSNVAVANASLNVGPIGITLELLDQSGRVVKTFGKQLGAAQYYQWNAPFANTGVRIGSAHVKCSPPAGATTCDFIAYGVVNDGAVPTQGTSDGSYIPMVRVK